MAVARSRTTTPSSRRFDVSRRGVSWRLAAGLLAFAGAGSGCRSQPALEEDRLLEELSETYVDERLRFYPVEATLAGLPGGDGRLGRFSRGAIEARKRWLLDFHHRVVGLRGRELSKPAYLDALWLTSLVKAELFELEQRRPWARSPSFYVETLRLGLVSLLLRREPGDGMPALLERLEAAPALVADALENLEGSSEPAREDALRSLERARGLLSSIPVFLDGRIAPASMEAVRRSSREAERSLAELERFVRASAADAKRESGTLGDEGLRAYWLHRDMIDVPLDELSRRAEERLVAIEDEIAAIGLRAFPERSRGELFAVRPAEGDVASLVRSSLDTLAKGLAARPPDEDVAPLDRPPVRSVPTSFLSPERIRLWHPALLEPGAVLVVGAAPEGAEPPAPSPIHRLDERDVDLLALREGLARLRLHGYQSSARSLLRRLYAARTTAEGWLRRHAARLLEEGVLGSGADPERELRARHRALLEWLRLAATMRFHAKGEELAEIETLFRTRGHLSPPLARFEAVRVAVDPGAGSAALGELLLSDLAREFRREIPFTSTAELDDLLLSEGVLPVRLIRFHLLDPALGNRPPF